MTAPALQSTPVTTVSSTTNSTSFASIGLATGTGGRHVVRVAAAAIGAMTASTGWNKLGQVDNGSNLAIAVFWSTTASSLTVTSASSTQFSAHATRDFDNTGLYMTAAGAFGATTNPNPPLLDMRKARDHRFEAVAARRGTGVPTVAPSGYTFSGTPVAGGGTSGAGLASATKSTTASSSEDPGTFTATTATWLAVTIGYFTFNTDRLSNYKAKVRAGASNVRILAVGTSFTAGRYNVGDGTDSQAGNSIAGARPAVWAAGFATMSAKHFLYGTGGLVNPSNTVFNALDNRWSPDSSFVTSDSFSFFMMGRAGWGLNTAGQKNAYTPGFAFDHVKLFYYSDPSLSAYTIDVNGGTPQSITTSAAAGYREQTFSLSGNSSAVINIKATAGGAVVMLAIEVYLSTAPQVSIFNAGWSSGNSNDMVGTGTNAGINGLLAMAPDLLVLEPDLNDTVAAITPLASQNNVRNLMLSGLASGDVIYSQWPYAQTGDEPSELAYSLSFKAICEELGIYYYDVRNETGWTSHTASNSAGYTNDTNVHPFPAGYTSWGGHELSVIDPGPLASAGTAAGTSTASAVGSAVKATVGAAAGLATALAVGAAVIAGVGSSAGSSTVSGVGNGLAQSVGSASGFSTASATTNSIFAGVGSSAGASTVSGVGSAISTANGSSAGTSTANGVGQGTGQMVGSAAGTSTASGAGGSVSASTGSAAGTSTATGLSSATATISGTGTSAGTSTANGVLSGLANMVGSAAGSSTANGVSAGTAIGTGLAAGSSSANAVGAVIMAATGNAAGTSSAAGNITALRLASGQAVGTSFALAVSNPLSIGTGTAQGTSTATGAGASSRPPDPAPVSRTLYVAYEDRTFPIAFENRTFLVSSN